MTCGILSKQHNQQDDIKLCPIVVGDGCSIMAYSHYSLHIRNVFQNLVQYCTVYRCMNRKLLWVCPFMAKWMCQNVILTLSMELLSFYLFGNSFIALTLHIWEILCLLWRIIRGWGLKNALLKAYMARMLHFPVPAKHPVIFTNILQQLKTWTLHQDICLVNKQKPCNTLI